MHADSVMLELLGLDAAPAPEDATRYGRTESRMNTKGMQETVSKAIASTRAEVQEVQYKWNHPPVGAYIQMQCGGRKDQEWEDGIRLRGDHQNITDTTHVPEGI